MRVPLLVSLSLLAAPVAAQTRAMAPATSILFRSSSIAAPQDTIKVDDGMSQRHGAMLGMALGASAGYLFGKLMEGNGDCTVNTAGGGCGEPVTPKGRVVAAAVGGVVGFFIGAAVAGPHVPKPARLPEPVRVGKPGRPDRGLKSWQGALLGGVVAALGTDYMGQQIENGAGGPGGHHRTTVELAGLTGLLIGGFSARN